MGYGADRRVGRGALASISLELGGRAAPTARLAAHAGLDGHGAEPQRGQLQARRDPCLHEGAELLVVAQVLARRRHVLLAHELRVTAPLPGEAHLVVRPVLARGSGLARTAGLATHVVLFGERARPKV